MTHAEFVLDLIADLPKPTTDEARVVLAQVHATMALVEAVEGWHPPTETPAPAPPFDQTKAGWQWEAV